MADFRTTEGKAANKNGILRAVFVALALVVQVLLIVLFFTRLSRYAEWIRVMMHAASLILVLVIYGQHKTSSMKMPWIILILTLPVFGSVLYFCIGLDTSTRRMRERFRQMDRIIFPALQASADTADLAALKKQNPNAGAIAQYLQDYAHYPVFCHTDIQYYDDAAKGLEAQLSELKKAERFIFMEYHAIENGSSWKRIEEVLSERVRAGVHVRVFYDDMGSIGFITTDFARHLEERGIHCRVFNPFVPGANLFLNYRDHRKITVIDNRVAFTGGYNLANEYFNITHPYGQWKDSGIRIEGPAVQSMTLTFLEMWNAVRATDLKDANVLRFLAASEAPLRITPGFVQPYADSPMDDEQVGENVYISMVSKAERYCYFITPYLIITDEMTHALSLAAKRGVDVRIITPGIPDKRMIYGVTRSFYNALVRNGVRIFEWTPGFCHAKMSVADDRMATCGTINLDYRSLYHHFENGCFMADCPAVMEVRKDFDRTFSECREVTDDYRTGRRGRGRRLWQLFLRLFAELM